MGEREERRGRETAAEIVILIAKLRSIRLKANACESKIYQHRACFQILLWRFAQNEFKLSIRWKLLTNITMKLYFFRHTVEPLLEFKRST